MRIAIADNNHRKFTNDLIEHWEKKHEVRYEPGASEYLAQWADLYYVDTWDNNIHYLYKLYHEQQEIPKDLKWDNNKKPKVVVRVLDWEVWIGLVRDQSIVDWVDKMICIAPHIEDRLRAELQFTPASKLKPIRPGVNLAKFTLKKKETDTFQLGMVLGDMWFPKQHMMGLDIFHRLWLEDKRWRLHIRGQHEGGNDFWKIMYEYFLESRGIQEAVVLYPYQEDMNQWLENIDILLHPGQKEAFCYAVGEALAKGIPAVVNDFYGSHDIWPEWLYQNSEQAIQKIKEYNKGGGQLEPRSYIKQHYSLDRMLKEIDAIL